MNHYLMVGRLIGAKLVTWEKLEQTGKALPTRQKHPFRSQSAKWFIETETKTKTKERQ